MGRRIATSFNPPNKSLTRWVSLPIETASVLRRQVIHRGVAIRGLSTVRPKNIFRKFDTSGGHLIDQSQVLKC
jgi:hypothetical protein